MRQRMRSPQTRPILAIACALILAIGGLPAGASEGDSEEDLAPRIMVWVEVMLAPLRPNTRAVHPCVWALRRPLTHTRLRVSQVNECELESDECWSNDGPHPVISFDSSGMDPAHMRVRILLDGRFLLTLGPPSGTRGCSCAREYVRDTTHKCAGHARTASERRRVHAQMHIHCAGARVHEPTCVHTLTRTPGEPSGDATIIMRSPHEQHAPHSGQHSVEAQIVATAPDGSDTVLARDAVSFVFDLLGPAGVCVCVCVFMHVYAYVYACIYMCMYMCVYKHASIYTYMHAQTSFRSHHSGASTYRKHPNM